MQNIVSSKNGGFSSEQCVTVTRRTISDAIRSRWSTADQLVFFVLPWLFVLPWQLWGTVLTGLTSTNNFRSNFWFGFWLDNKSSFRSFYVLIYCSKKRVYIVRKTKVRKLRNRARNSNFFWSDECYKHSLCGGGQGNDYCSLDTSEGGGVGQFFDEKGEVWTVSRRKIMHNSFNKSTLNVD